MYRMDRLMTKVQRLFEVHPIEQHPLFCMLRDGRLSRSEMSAIALEIFHVVDAFPRFLAAVLMQLTDWSRRMDLVANLFAEHGRGDPVEVHVVSYRRFLHGLGVEDACIDASVPRLSSTSYVRAVLDLCARAEPTEALAALGVIEEIVARVSPIVAHSARALLRDSHDSHHFTLHEVLDLSHAREIYALAAAEFHGTNEPVILRGLALGMLYHRRLYDDLVDGYVSPELRNSYSSFPRAIQVAELVFSEHLDVGR